MRSEYAHQDERVDELIGMGSSHNDDGAMSGDPPSPSGMDFSKESVQDQCEHP